MVRAKPLVGRLHASTEATWRGHRSSTGKSLGRSRPQRLARSASATRRPGGARAKAAPPTFAPATAEGKPWLSISQQFNRGTDEGFYGLGQHQYGQMNYNGEDVELAQHNMDVAIPFVVSTRNYGLLWDNNSITRFGDPQPYTYAGGAGRRTAGQRRRRLDRDDTRSTARPSRTRTSRRSSCNISKT